MRQTAPYKLPIIVRAKNDWFVKYFYEVPDHPGVFKEFRVRDGVNYIHDEKEREIAILELCEDIRYALEKKDHNPFKKDAVILRQVVEQENIIAERAKKLTLSAAMMFVISEKIRLKRAPSTLESYYWVQNIFIPWCTEHNLIHINEPNIDHIEQFLAEKLESEEWSPRTYNNKIDILITFFKYLAQRRKLAASPITGGMIETIKNTAEKNKYYDQETLDLILPEVNSYPVLQRFIRWTYYSCARGTELRGLRVRDVDLKIKKIVIMADNGKTGEYVGRRNIPLCQELNDLIVGEKLKNLPGDWYVFGDKGNPGPMPISEGYMSDIYFRIKTKLKIDFKFTIYSFKHTRVIDLLIAGFDPIKVMYLTGHEDWGSFQAYIRELGAVMDKQMIGNTLKLSI